MSPVLLDDAAKRRALLVSATGTFLVLLVYTAPMGALDHTFEGLAAGTSARAWIVSAMSVGLSAALLASGAIADAFGRRRLLVVGAAILALGSLLATVAASAEVFIAARLLQGVGGAAVTACSLGILGHTFPAPAERTRATAVWGASLGAGIAIGPLVSAGLEVATSWRGAHALSVVGSVMLAFAASRFLVESRAASPKPVDMVGTGWLVAGLAGLCVGLVELRDGASATTLALLVGGLVALLGFVMSQRRPAPLLDLQLFRHPDFVAATGSAFMTGLGIISMMSFIPILLYRGLGHSMVVAATLTLAWSVASVLSSAATRRLPERITPRQRLVGSQLALAAGQLMIGSLDADASILRLMPGLVIAGLATGVLNATLGRQAVASVPASNAAMGSGANNTARYLGAAFGMTLMALLLGRAAPTEVVPQWNLAVLVTTGFTLAGALVAFVCRPRAYSAASVSTSGTAPSSSPE